MKTRHEPDTNELVQRAAGGDSGARRDLLGRHREQLRQMVLLRMDRRLRARFDPSDVVQDALLTAAVKLSDYLRRQPLPFYPWLRQIALEQLIELHRRHVQAQKRSVSREVAGVLDLPEDSAAELASRLLAGGVSPNRGLVREELCRRVRDALLHLPPRDCEILILRHLEELSTREIAAVLGLSESAVKMRHLRALERLRVLLEKEPPEDEG
jgi:RNA polymerase sigma-70 factor (ECF subfamily)